MEREPKSDLTPSKIVSIDEAIELHHHEHIIMRVTEFDERDNPILGIVVAHGPNADEVSSQFAIIDPGSDLPKARYCFFSGYRRIHSNEELIQAMQAIEEGTEIPIDVPDRSW